MIVSKAFWKIAIKNIGTIILYTIILLLFGSINMNTSTTTTQYEAKKPSIVVFNHDERKGVTDGFMTYLEKNTDIKTDYADDDRLKDALFYEDVALALDIPENYHQDIALGRNPEIRMRASAGYSAELAKVVVKRYLTIAQAYAATNLSEADLAAMIDKTLEKNVTIDIKSSVDTSKYSKPTRYFSFANYSILACVITIICLIMSAFNRVEIRKRNLISRTELKQMDRVLLKNCCIYAFGVWLLYIILGFVTIGSDVLWSAYGLLYTINSLVFTICATTIAYVLSKLVHSQSAISGVMNVVALGSSFLCGGFVPAEYLPDSVLAFAHILPSYYYIDANNKIMAIESFDWNTLWPIILNIAIVICFSFAFVALAAYISRKKQKIA